VLIPGKTQEISKEIMKYKTDRQTVLHYKTCSKDKTAGTCKENGSGSDAKEDDGKKSVYGTKEWKTSSEMDGWMTL